jgi:hypothetical protein
MPDTWTCKFCTFENPEKTRKCQVCKSFQTQSLPTGYGETFAEAQPKPRSSIKSKVEPKSEELQASARSKASRKSKKEQMDDSSDDLFSDEDNDDDNKNKNIKNIKPTPTIQKQNQKNNNKNEKDGPENGPIIEPRSPHSRRSRVETVEVVEDDISDIEVPSAPNKRPKKNPTKVEELNSKDETDQDKLEQGKIQAQTGATTSKVSKSASKITADEKSAQKELNELKSQLGELTKKLKERDEQYKLSETQLKATKTKLEQVNDEINNFEIETKNQREKITNMEKAKKINEIELTKVQKQLLQFEQEQVEQSKRNKSSKSKSSKMNDDDVNNNNTNNNNNNKKNIPALLPPPSTLIPYKTVQTNCTPSNYHRIINNHRLSPIFSFFSQLSLELALGGSALLRIFRLNAHIRKLFSQNETYNQNKIHKNKVKLPHDICEPSEPKNKEYQNDSEHAEFIDNRQDFLENSNFICHGSDENENDEDDEEDFVYTPEEIYQDMMNNQFSHSPLPVTSSSSSSSSSSPSTNLFTDPLNIAPGYEILSTLYPPTTNNEYYTVTNQVGPGHTPASIFHSTEAHLLPHFNQLFTALCETNDLHKYFLSKTTKSFPISNHELFMRNVLSLQSKSQDYCTVFAIPPCIRQYNPIIASLTDQLQCQKSKNKIEFSSFWGKQLKTITRYNRHTRLIHGISPSLIPELLYPDHLFGISDLYSCSVQNTDHFSNDPDNSDDDDNDDNNNNNAGSFLKWSLSVPPPTYDFLLQKSDEETLNATKEAALKHFDEQYGPSYTEQKGTFEELIRERELIVQKCSQNNKIEEIEKYQEEIEQLRSDLDEFEHNRAQILAKNNINLLRSYHSEIDSVFYEDFGQLTWPPLPVSKEHPHGIDLKYTIAVQHDNLYPKPTQIEQTLRYTTRQWIEIVKRFPPLPYHQAIIFRSLSLDKELSTLIETLAPYLATKNIHYVPVNYTTGFSQVSDDNDSKESKKRPIIPTSIPYTHIICNVLRATERTITAVASGASVVCPHWLFLSLLHGDVLPLDYIQTGVVCAFTSDDPNKFHDLTSSQTSQLRRHSSVQSSSQDFMSTGHSGIVAYQFYLQEVKSPHQVPLYSLQAKYLLNLDHITSQFKSHVCKLLLLSSSPHCDDNSQFESILSMSERDYTNLVNPNDKKSDQFKQSLQLFKLLKTTLNKTTPTMFPTIPSLPYSLSLLPQKLRLRTNHFQGVIFFVCDGSESSPTSSTQSYSPSQFNAPYIRNILRSAGATVLDIGDFIETILCGIMTFPKNEIEQSIEINSQCSVLQNETKFSYNWQYFLDKFNITTFNKNYLQSSVPLWWNNTNDIKSHHIKHISERITRLTHDDENNNVQVNNNYQTVEQINSFQKDPNYNHLEPLLHSPTCPSIQTLQNCYDKIYQNDPFLNHPLLIISPTHTEKPGTANVVIDAFSNNIIPYALQHKDVIYQNINLYKGSCPSSSSQSQPLPILPTTTTGYINAILNAITQFPIVPLTSIFSMIMKGHSHSVQPRGPSNSPGILYPCLPPNQTLSSDHYKQLANNLIIPPEHSVGQYLVNGA